MLTYLQLLPVLPLWGIFLYHVIPKLSKPMTWGKDMDLNNVTSLLVTLAELFIVIIIPIALVLLFIKSTKNVGMWLFITALSVAFLVMLGAIILVHGQKGFNGLKGGMEFHILILFVCIQLAISSYLIESKK